MSVGAEPRPSLGPLFETRSRQNSSGESAGDESRTRDLNVGNVALYQLSYSRVATRIIASVDLEISLIRRASQGPLPARRGSVTPAQGRPQYSGAITGNMALRGTTIRL